jgi:hypothetical protein
MAIAESGTAPASVQSATNVATTASFTPVANSLLIAEVTVGNSTGSGLTTGAITDSLSSTWTLLKRSNISGSGCSEVWGMDAGASPAARTVTLTGTASVGQGTVLTVKVLTGAAAVASCLGASVAQGTTATSASITTTTAGSYVAGGVSHSEANVALTANGSTTLDSNFADASNGSSYATFHATSLTGTPGAIILGLSTATSANYVIALAEILPGAPTGFVPPAFTGVVQRHRRR